VVDVVDRACPPARRKGPSRAGCTLRPELSPDMVKARSWLQDLAFCGYPAPRPSEIVTTL